MALTLTANLDCYFDSILNTTNNDTSNPQNAGFILTGSGIFHGVIGFDATSIPERIRRATLSYYQIFITATQRDFVASLVDPLVTVDETTATWDISSTGVPWATPGGDVVGSPVQFTAPNSTNLYVDVDVTALVKAWLANPSYVSTGQINFLLGANPESGSTRRIQYQPRLAANPAKLTIATPTGSLVLTMTGGGLLVP